jgi:hypothetical protein
MPERLVVKRAVRAAAGGWLLASDNGFAGGDSGTHGTADVVGVVLARWTGRGWRRLLPRPVR